MYSLVAGVVRRTARVEPSAVRASAPRPSTPAGHDVAAAV